MILPLSTISPDTRYSFPNLYEIGYGVGRRMAPGQPPVAPPPPIKTEIRDAVTLSPAAQRLMDQANRLDKMQSNL